MQKTMIIAPHPDDAELAMGGTIAKMVKAGWHVTVIDLTDGEPTPFGSKQIRATETAQATSILGIQNRLCLEMPNRYLENTLENRKQLSETIRLHKPDMIFGPVLPDYHPDHIAATQLLDGARFEAKFHNTDMAGTPHFVEKRYAYYSTHRHGITEPSFIVDISDVWETKMMAINAYQSQIKNSLQSVNTLLEKIECISRYFGQCIDCKYGEPFSSFQPIKMCLEGLST